MIKTIAKNSIIPKLSKSEILLGDSLYDNEQHILTGMTNTKKKLNATKREKLIGNMVHSVRQNVERIYRSVRENRCFDMTWQYSWKLHRDAFYSACYLTNLKFQRKRLDTLE